MKVVTTHEAKRHLSKLLAAVESGEEVIVCKGKQRVAKLVPYHQPRQGRPPVGVPTSKSVRYARDCFAPLSDNRLAKWDLG